MLRDNYTGYTETLTELELLLSVQDRLNALVVCLCEAGVVDRSRYEKYVMRMRAETDQIRAAIRDEE